MHTTSPHRLILREYRNSARRRDRHQPDRGAIASDGMAHRARELWIARLPMSEVVHQLREAATKAGVLDQVHVIRHGHDLDGPRLIPEGATNRQIIEMIERAD